MRKILIIGILIALLAGIGLISQAQVGGGVFPANLIKKVDNAILPIQSNWTLGSSSQRWTKGWFTDLDTTNILIGGSASGNLDMANNLILNIGNDGTDFTSGGGLTLAGVLTANETVALATTTITGNLTVNTTDLFVQKSTGRVGIGTTGPGQKLDVAGTIRRSDVVLNATILEYTGSGLQGRIVARGGGGPFVQGLPYVFIGSVDGSVGAQFSTGYSGAPMLTLYPATDQEGLRVGAGGGTSAVFLGNVGIGTTGPGTNRLRIQGATSDTTAFGLRVDNSAGAGLMVVRNDGNVGIGTTAPGAKLTVFDSSLATLRVQRGSNISAELIAQNEGYLKLVRPINSNHIGTFIYTDTNLDWVVGAYGGTPAGAFTITQGSGNIPFTISTTGNVGIGTTTPQSLLQIGTPNAGGRQYLQIDVTETAPPSTDCDALTEVGRMITYATTTEMYLFVCPDASGWATSSLVR